MYGKHFFIIINFIIIMIIIYSAQLSHISLTIIMNKYTYILYHLIFDHQIFESFIMEMYNSCSLKEATKISI